MRTYKDFHLISLDETGHQETCNYWYLVHHGAVSHTAFETVRGLYRWADERGLKVVGELPEAKTFGVLRIDGEYRDFAHMNAEDFAKLEPIITSKTLSNGDYVVAKITRDADGVRTVHTLNPNVKDRQVFDYWEAAKEMR